MPTLSKYFAEKVTNLTCKELIHPDFDSCLSFIWYLHRTAIITTLKYYAPVFLFRLALKYKKISRKDCKESAVSYVRTGLVTSVICCVAAWSSCFLYNIFKKFRLYTLIAMPAFITISTLTQFYPQNYINLEILTINNLFIQTMLRNFDYKILQIVRESRTLSTLSFMLISSAIMGLLSLTKSKKKRFWYTIQPEPFNKDSTPEIEIGNKEIRLKNLLWQELQRSTKLGLVITSIRSLFSRVYLLKIDKFKFLTSFILNFDYKLFGFFVSYGISFQAINYFLNRSWNKTKQYRNALIAGFLAGLNYYLSPRFFTFTYGFTMAIDLITQCSLERADQHSKVVKFLQNVPWMRLLFFLSIAAYGHWKVTNPHMVINFINGFLQAGPNKRFDIMAKNYAKHVLGI